MLQDTIPTWVSVPVRSSGPPESPLHWPFPPSGNPAQIWVPCSWVWWRSLHSASLNTCSWTFCRSRWTKPPV
ncbi:hypothetical protein M5D96_008949 [Drosophila gunungcola]|uniref:Uncharacterized protein n=1 Tax=Drosophila gunungcola TaxID=103775 RepID=A0A9P9YJP6_9MUSC|nr:hypothetical protein M5D96_008949 [Drosophila gunungcola]